MSARTCVISDFDGTLARIRADPQKVKLSRRMYMLLCRLRDNGIKLVVISARPKKFLQRVLPTGIMVIGSRGNPTQPGLSEEIRKIKKALLPVARHFPGALVEPGPCGVDFHYRNCRNADDKKILNGVKNAVKFLNVKIVNGRKMFGVQLGSMADKQEIVKKITKNWAGKIVFLGDDESDAKAAREVIKRKNGKAFLLRTSERKMTPRGAKKLSGMKNVYGVLSQVLK